MVVTLDEAKRYLRVDSEDEDDLIESIIVSAENLCFDIARTDDSAFYPNVLKTAILYAIGYLFEHREEADHGALTKTLRDLLSQVREEVF